MKKYSIISIFITCILILSSCKKDNTPAPNNTTVYNHYVSHQFKVNYSVASLKTAAAFLNQPEVTNLIKYDVSVFTVVYKTMFKGSMINCSGLVFLPANPPAPSPLVSIQHGTTFVKTDVPSVTTSPTGGELVASMGFVAIMPDFIGYGASSTVFHPYYDAQYSGTSIVDMIKAVKEMSTKLNVPINDKLFLTGYSEGGYVTLAAAKEIQDNPSHKLNLTAASAGAGAYDLPSFLTYLTNTNYFSYPAYLAFIVASYKNTYDWTQGYDYFFNSKYAQKIPDLLNGLNDGSAINAQLTTNPDSLFNPVFYNGMKNKTEVIFYDALVKNDLSSWKPMFPLRLYHGTEDEIIPIQNSTITYQKFIEKGSPNVTFIGIPGANHGTGVLPMLQSTMQWFLELTK